MRANSRKNCIRGRHWSDSLSNLAMLDLFMDMDANDRLTFDDGLRHKKKLYGVNAIVIF